MNKAQFLCVTCIVSALLKQNKLLDTRPQYFLLLPQLSGILTSALKPWRFFFVFPETDWITQQALSDLFNGKLWVCRSTVSWVVFPTWQEWKIKLSCQIGMLLEVGGTLWLLNLSDSLNKRKWLFPCLLKQSEACSLTRGILSVLNVTWTDVRIVLLRNNLSSYTGTFKKVSFYKFRLMLSIAL